MRVCTHQSRRLILRKSTCFVLFSRAAQRSTWKEQGVSWVTARRACLHHVVPVLVSNLHFFRSSLDGRVRHLIHRQNDDGLENDGAPRDEQIRSESQRVDKLQSAGSIRACGGRNDKILSGHYAGRNRQGITDPQKTHTKANAGFDKLGKRNPEVSGNFFPSCDTGCAKEDDIIACRRVEVRTCYSDDCSDGA